MTEKEKMEAGLWYDANNDQELIDQRLVCQDLCFELNQLKPSDKKRNEMCFIEGFDETGNVEGVVFSSTYQRYKTLLEKNRIVCIEGKMNYRDKLSLVVQNVKEVNEV